jgi:hypothetical protein
MTLPIPERIVKMHKNYIPSFAFHTSPPDRDEVIYQKSLKNSTLGVKCISILIFNVPWFVRGELVEP